VTAVGDGAGHEGVSEDSGGMPRNAALWGGRFDGAADPLFRILNDSIAYDRHLLEEDIDGSIAWANAIARAGVISDDDATRLRDGLEAVRDEGRADPQAIADSGEEDIHSWVESRLVARLGDLGKRLHTGRSRNDQVATDLRLWTRRQLCARRDEIHAAVASLLALAEREIDTAMPGFTHLQHGQPVLMAHWALAYVEMLRRDDARLSDCVRRLGECPLGSGALAGTAYPIDREAIARELGFARPTRNSLDAISDRDFVVEALAASSLCAVHLSRLAEDLIVWSSQPFALVEMDDAVTSGSSLMPQKKNPDAAELLRGRVGRIVGALVTLLTVVKGLPMAYNKDLQEDKEPLFDAMRTLSQSLRIVVPLIDGLRVDQQRCRDSAGAGHSNATELADWLVHKGVPFRDAHDTVGKIVRMAIAAGVRLEELPLEQMREIEPRLTGDVYAWLTPESAIERRAAMGGTATARVEEAIAEAWHWLDQERGRDDGSEGGGDNGGDGAGAGA